MLLNRNARKKLDSCEQETHKIFCPKWIYYIMSKVHKGMFPPLFSGATGGENNPKTNSNLTGSYLKKKVRCA